jgi:hypothetical protein
LEVESIDLISISSCVLVFFSAQDVIANTAAKTTGASSLV